MDDPCASYSGEDVASGKRQDPARSHQDGVAQVLNDLPSDCGTTHNNSNSHARQVELVVTIVRAEGLVDSAPSGIFRWSSKSKPQGRYFRVRVLDVVEGGRVLDSAETSLICAQGSEFHWDTGGEKGEDLYLLLEPMFLNRGVLLEVEMLHRESAGDDLLLGRGQTALKNMASLGNGEVTPRWVHLTLEGKPKGRIEIIAPIASPVSNALANRRPTKPDVDGAAEGSDAWGSKLNGSSNKDETFSRTIGDVGGQQGDSRHHVLMAEECQDPKIAISSQPNPHKWGMPRMPELKNTITAGIARVANLKASGPEKTAGGETDPTEKGNVTRGQSKMTGEGDSGVKNDTDKRSTTKDEVEQQATRENAPSALPAKGDRDGRRGFLTARYGMHSLKKSLQAKLTGASGNSRVDREQNDQGLQDEGSGVYTPEESLSSGSRGSRGLHGSRGSPAQLQEKGHSRSPSSDKTLKSNRRPDVSQQPEGDEAVEEIEEPTDTWKEQETNNTRNAVALEDRASYSDSVSVLNFSDTTPLTDRKRATGRRYSLHQVGSGSSLRSLLRENVTYDIDASEGKFGETSSSSDGGGDSYRKPDGDSDDEHTPADVDGEHTPTDADDNGVASKTEGGNVFVTQNFSSSAFTESVKLTAARLKTTLSSQAFSAMRKGFGLPRSRVKNTEDGDERGGDSCPPMASQTNSGDQINPSKLLPCAPEVGLTSTDIPASGDALPDVSSTTYTLLTVRILRASGLPEKLAKGSFGRMKQGATQDPYVRLKVCDIVAATSAVNGGGGECRWGNKKEGEMLEVPIPRSVLPEDDGLESLRLSVEVLNKADEESEKDILLGSADLVIADWLGRGAAWAQLELRGSRGGRVKLSIGVKGYLKAKLQASQSSQKLQTKHSEVGYEGMLTADAASTASDSQTVRGRTLSDDTAINLGQNIEKKRNRENEYAGKSGGMPTIDEDEGTEQDSVSRSSWSSGAERADAVRKASGGSRRDCERRKSVPSVQRAEDLHETRAAHSGSYRVASASKPDAAASRDSALVSEEGFPPRRGEQVTSCNVEDVQRLLADPSGGPASVEITIRVRKADSLAASVPKTMFGKTTKIASHNPYVILEVCGSRLSTSAVIGGGSKCRWSGEHGRAIVLSASYADLTASGWGKAPWESPKLRVEVWDQISPTRTADTMIGSTDVSLKNIVGIGATWIDISRENVTTGRVKLHVESPDLHRSGFVGRHGNVAEGDEKRGRESHKELEAHRASLHRRGNSVGGDEPDGIGVVPAGRNREREVETITITTPDKGASDMAVIPSSGHADRHDPESMQAKHNVPSSAIEKRLGSCSGTGSTSQVADCQPPPSDSWGVQMLGLAQKKIPEGFMKSHVGGEHLGEKTDEPNGIDPRGIVSGEEGYTSSKLEEASADETFGGLQRRLQGGAATALDLGAIGATVLHVGGSPGDEKTAPTLRVNASGHMTPASANASSTSAPRNFQTWGQGSDSLHTARSARSGIDESNIEELVCSRQLKSRGDLSCEISHQYPVVRVNEASERRRTALDGDRDRDGKGLGTAVTNNNPSCSMQVPFAGKHARLRGPGGPSTQIDPSSVVLVPDLIQEKNVKRIARAREIARRREGMNRSSGVLTRGHSGQRSILPPFGDVGVIAAERIDQVSAVTTIQCVVRGWFTRRSLRCCQRAAVHIQGVFRGHRERKHFLGLRGWTRRARAEEQRARERRSRIASTQQELYLLLRIPAKDLGKIDYLRNSVMASRIQRFWRRLCGGVHFYNTIREHGARTDSLRREGVERVERGEEWVVSGGKRTITAPEIEWLRSDRVPASALTLEALRRRVATRQRAKECSSEETRPRSACSPSVLKVISRKVNAGGRMLGIVDSTYESMITHREQASSLMAALDCSETERVATVKRRGERLDKFRSLQDQLLNPPKLDGGADRVLSNTHDSSTGTAVDICQQLRGWKVGGDRSKWQVTSESSERRRRGERAHTLAAAVAQGAGNKWWTASLPADVGYDELVDIRRVESPWSTAPVRTGRRRRYARTSSNASVEVAGESKYDSDEASLWWYTYASAGTGRAAGQRRKDAVFTELLERVKTSQVRRRERLENQDRERRRRIARKSQRLVDEVIHQQDAARCPGLSCLRGRVTAAQKRAATAIQSRVRGVLQRKKTAALRAKMRVFGALQILINELRRAELEDMGSDGSLRGLADVLAERAGKNEVDARRILASAVAARRAVPIIPPTVLSQSAPQPAFVFCEQDKSMTTSMDQGRTTPDPVSQLQPYSSSTRSVEGPVSSGRQSSRRLSTTVQGVLASDLEDTEAEKFGERLAHRTVAQYVHRDSAAECGATFEGSQASRDRVPTEGDFEVP